MAEIAINLKGQDNLTQTVKNAKKSVDDLRYSSTELGKCSKEFDRITSAGKPLKTTQTTSAIDGWHEPQRSVKYG